MSARAGSSRRNWQDVESLLDAALDLDPTERRKLLDRECGENSDLRSDLEAMMRACDLDQGFLEISAVSFAGDLVEGTDLQRVGSFHGGSTVGPYRLIRELARGGMGTVYLAERADGQFEQRVALKVIKRGMDSDEIHRRFLAERQILARLSHVHIARLLDGGVTNDGQPWFAMEYVEGVAITRHCDAQRLGARARLRLFEDVCEAVRYAHQNLIVHRDLKPSNILVTHEGGVKLLDFGIAKLLDETPGEQSQIGTGLRALTPEYAAPEQVLLDPITTATDVYALGAVLYELLTGRRAQAFNRPTPAEIERVICQVDPAPPGVSTDLDTIVLKALRKDPARRYVTVDALLDDIRRYQAGLPVRARPDTAAYRTRKFLRRHRIGVAAATITALSLVGGIAAAFTQTRVARREAGRAGEVKSFLVGLFTAANPAESRGREVTARELLDRGRARLDTALASQPELHAELLDVIGSTYNRLGYFAQADTMFERSVELTRRIYGEEHSLVAQRLTRWAEPVWMTSQYERADSLLVYTLQLRERELGVDHPDLAPTVAALANVRRLMAEYPESERLYRRALTLRREARSTDQVQIATDLRLMGLSLWEMGKYSAADSALQEALAIQNRLLDSEHPAVTSTLRNIAHLRRSQGNLVEAERLGRDVLARRRRLFPNGHSDLSNALAELAETLELRGAFPEAETLSVATLEMRRTLMGENTVETKLALSALARLYVNMGRLDDAEVRLKEAVPGLIGLVGPGHPHTLAAQYNLALLRMERGDLVPAESLHRQVLDSKVRVLGPRHTSVAGSRRMLGVTLHRLGRLNEAEAMLRQSVALFRETLPERHPITARALTDLGALLIDRGQAQAAEPLLREALSIQEEKLLPNALWMLNTRRELARCLSVLGRRSSGNRAQG